MYSRSSVLSLVAVGMTVVAPVVRAQCEGTLLRTVDNSQTRLTSPVVFDPDGSGPRAGIMYALGFPRLGVPGWVTYDGNTWSDTPGLPPGVTTVAFGTTGIAHQGSLFTSDMWRWNGAAWSRANVALDGSLLASAVYAIHQGQLIAFASTPTLGQAIFSWNGSAWQVLTTAVTAGGASGSPLNRTVLLSDGINIILVTNMTSINGVAAPGIARWDGTAWSTFGGGLGGQVRNARIINNQLYIVGSSLSEGQLARGSVRRWTGTAWQNVYSSAFNTSDVINDIAQFGGQFYIMGSISTGPSTRQPYAILQPDTATYTPFAGEVVTNAQSFGGFVQYDGKLHAVAMNTNNGDTTTAAVTDVIAGQSATPVRPSQFVGSGVRIQRGRPLSDSAFAFAPIQYLDGGWRSYTPTALDAGFDFEGQTYRVVTLTANALSRVERLDGNTWVAVGQPVPFIAVRLVRLGPKLAVYGNNATTGQIYGWNGTNWESLASPIPLVDSNSLGLVEVLQYNNEIHALGNITSPNGSLWILRWTGSDWTRVGPGIQCINNIPPTDMHVDAQNRLWVVGRIEKINGGNTSSLAMAIWDGVNFTGYPAVNTSAAIYEIDGQTVALGRGTARLVNGTLSYRPFPTNEYNFASSSTFNAAIGNQVHTLVRIASNGESTALSISLDGKNQILRQPASSNVACGQVAEFTILATPGMPNQSFQWKRNGIPLVDTPLAGSGAVLEGATRSRLRILNASANQAGEYTCDVVGPCNTITSTVTTLTVTGCSPTCDSIDFNNNTVFPEDQDVIDFFTVLAGGPCSPGNICNDIDFNNNGVFPEDADVIDFFNVLAGAECQ